NFDAEVLGFAFLCSVLTGIAVGLVPAWTASRADVNQVLKQSVSSATAARSHRRFRQGLIVAQVTFALMLLTVAGTFVRGLNQLIHAEPGWRVDGLLVAQLNLSGPRYESSEARMKLFQLLRERLLSIQRID